MGNRVFLRHVFGNVIVKIAGLCCLPCKCHVGSKHGRGSSQVDRKKLDYNRNSDKGTFVLVANP